MGIQPSKTWTSNNDSWRLACSQKTLSDGSFHEVKDWLGYGKSSNTM